MYFSTYNVTEQDLPLVQWRDGSEEGKPVLSKWCVGVGASCQERSVCAGACWYTKRTGLSVSN